ncbi:MAG: hypothetical protein ACOC1F_09710, partial [Myxococcota bacterium]
MLQWARTIACLTLTTTTLACGSSADEGLAAREPPSYPGSGGSGGSTAVGGSGGTDAYGTGGDAIFGGPGDDVVFGDGAYVQRSSSDQVEKAWTLFGDHGGDDVIDRETLMSLAVSGTDPAATQMGMFTSASMLQFRMLFTPSDAFAGNLYQLSADAHFTVHFSDGSSESVTLASAATADN